MAMVTLLAGRLPLQSPLRLAVSTNAARADPCKLTQLSMRRSAVVQAASGSAAMESEDQRLQLDADAMRAMAAVAEEAQAGEAPGAWKWAIRKRVWDLLESENLAQLPRPVHHRIPNFVGAGAAAAKLASLPAFEAARCVKVNPDTPQKQVRFLTLHGKKTLMTPQPRLRAGFFSILESSSIPYLPDACTSAGVAKFGKPISLDDKIKVDLLVIGSVAVDPATGARLGKGEGFAELEYGMLRLMGAIDDSTLVVTTVHDQQLVDDIPLEKLLIHDVPVDIICTPTQIIHTNTKIPKPQGIYWEKLSRQKLAQIRVLQDLKTRIEKETSATLPSAPDEILPPLAARKRPPAPGNTRRSSTATASKQTTIFMWNIPPSIAKRMLQDHVVAAVGGDVVQTVRTSLKPGSNRQLAWVILKDGTDAAKVVEALDQSTLGEMVLRAKVDDPKFARKASEKGRSTSSDN